MVTQNSVEQPASQLGELCPAPRASYGSIPVDQNGFDDVAFAIPVAGSVTPLSPIELQSVPMTGYNTIPAHLSPPTEYQTVVAEQLPWTEVHSAPTVPAYPLLTELPPEPTASALVHYGYIPGMFGQTMSPLLNGMIGSVDQNGFDDAAFAIPTTPIVGSAATPGNTPLS